MAKRDERASARGLGSELEAREGADREAAAEEGVDRRGRRRSSGRRASRNARTAVTREAGAIGDALTDEQARRELEASSKLYYRIGEVSRLTGVKAHVLRYWETEFRWMAPPKSRSRQRLYRKRDIEFVWLLKRLLWDERYTIAGARQRIQELGVDGALALLTQDRRTPIEPGPGHAGAGDASATARGASGAHWGAVRAAIASMQQELLDLRGVLQEGD